MPNGARDPTLCPIRVRRQASTLPGSVYHDEGFYALEQERVWRASWVAGVELTELANPGDVLPVNIGGANIILANDRGESVNQPATALARRCVYICVETFHSLSRSMSHVPVRSPVLLCPSLGNFNNKK